MPGSTHDQEHVDLHPDAPIEATPERDRSALDPTPNPFLLRLPTPPSNNSQSSFVISDLVQDDNGGEPLSSEIASADISIAPDLSFVETSSGPAAYELKRRYDQHFGVGKDVRSPYAITAFTNQHGKQMFRVGRKELPAPAAEAEQRASTQSSVESSYHDPPTSSRRRSRISVHGFLTSSAMFKTGGAAAKPQSSAPRKLRKTRSISDMATSGSSIASSSENPTPPPARQHSQSVTAADMPRFITVDIAVPRTGDIFAEVMHWNDLPANSSGSAPESIVVHPFGPGISFDSPSRRPASEYLPAPRLLREVQSFESGLTARQIEPETRRTSESLSDATSSDDSQLSRPPSAVRLRASTLSTLENVDVEPEPIPLLAPLPETSMHSRYSTDVFDVLQTYRGLPLLDKLSPDSEETTVIKMSLSADETAAPRDDPRFVIWGEMQSERDISEDLSASQGSLTDISSSTRSSNASLRKRNTRAAKAASKAAAEIPSLHLSPEDALQKVLIAATIERWIAQLTSDLDYDELLNFFLTYRTYISAVDLCHLLICRFHWALSQHTSAHDEMVRRVVRVRTFVAIRYWLLTFFVVDFLPNRELRLVLANWLNALIRDPILQKYSDGLNIVKKLKKVVKDCKKTHTRSASKPKLRAPTTKRHVLGEKFAEATRKTDGDDDGDSDVDLDFLPDDGTMPDVPSGLKNDHVNAHLSVPHVGAGLSPTRPDSIPSSSLSILQQTNRAPGPGPDPELPFIQTSATLPIHHNALSRVFVKTIGRLGRWKRVLNSRAATRAPLGVCVDVSAFDLELSVSRDLLTVNGGVEQYLKMIEPQPAVVSPQGSDRPILSPIASSAPKLPSLKSPPPILQNDSELELLIDDHLSSASDANPIEEVLPVHVPAPDDSSSRSSSSDSLGVTMSPRATPGAMPLVEATQIILPRDDSSSRSSSPDSLGGPSTQSHISPENNDDVSTRSSSLGSLGVPLSPRVHSESDSPMSVPSASYPLSQTAGSSHSSSSDSLGVLLSPNAPNASFPGARSPWEFDVVSIDDLDLSDTSSDLHAAGPPGLRKLPQKKLPSQAQVRAQFEFLRRRSESVSSMGIISHASLASARSSVVSEEGSAAGLGGNIQQWQMNALLDSLSNDEETGDVEAALRKLEGELSPLKQQEKASKVDGWVRTIQERMAAGDYSDDHPRFSDDEAEEQSPDEDDFEEERASMSDDQPEPENGIEQQQEWAKTPVATHPSHGIPSSPTRAEAKPAPEDAVPLEILQSRLSSRPLSAEQPTYVGSKFGGPDAPKIHRSFILLHRAEALAQHFSMIDRELFMGVKFEELVLDDWMSCEEVNVLDWGQYLKDRARWKAESRWADKTTALAAVRARFNLMTNFTISEIVLTQPSERALLVGKFIRIAWKAYTLSNFSTLVAIITGLESNWVKKAMGRSWNRVGLWETRMLRDLQRYTTSGDQFKFIRLAIDSIVDAKPLDVNSRSASVVSAGAGAEPSSGSKGKGPDNNNHKVPIVPSACVPFIGVYLSQLYQYNRLPDLIDPTAPNEAVGIDPITANFDAPAHPEVFSALTPLPPSMHLEPLINVHKQRLIANVIKSLVAGQHLASRVHFPIDKKLFQKCLKLRGLDGDMLKRALAMYPE